MKINDMSEKELETLKKEIREREKVIQHEKALEEIAETKQLLEDIMKVDLLRHFNHTRTSCSDESPTNSYVSSDGYARCTKCHLIQIIEDYKDGLDPEFKIELDFSIRKIQKA